MNPTQDIQKSLDLDFLKNNTQTTEITEQSYMKPREVTTPEKQSSKGLALQVKGHPHGLKYKESFRKELENIENLSSKKKLDIEKLKAEEATKIKINVEELQKDLHLALVFKTSLTSQSYTQKIAAVLESLENCELLNEKQSQTACRILTTIAQSDASWILTHQFAVNILSKMWKSAQISSTVKYHMV